jgi:protein-tyrosine phosphatase
MSDIPPVRVLFVCMGNICRSPTAHGVFQALVETEGLVEWIEVDSAGTHSYHTGNPPDPRSQAMARSRGVDLSSQRARRFESSDFVDFDYVIGMDRSNLADMQAIRPEQSRARFGLMLEYSSTPQTEVPDPYFGDAGFERVFDLIEDASRGLLRHIRETHGI